MFVEIIKMDNKDELKEIDIKNRTCYCFDGIMTDWNICSGYILLLEKVFETYKKISIYDISYKTSTGANPLHIRLDEIDGFIKIYDGVRCWVLFDHVWFDKICDRIKYFISKKSGIKDSINHNFGIIRIDSYNHLPIEKILTFHNVIILIKSVVKKNKNE